jgi:hypothetical protein
MESDLRRASLKDLIAATAFIVVSIFAVVIIRSGGVASSMLRTETLTYATLPTVYGALLAVLSTILAAVSLKKLRLKSDSVAIPEEPKKRRSVFVRTFGTLVLTAAYAYLLEHLPFFILTTCFLATLFLLFGRRPFWIVACLSILGGGGFYFLFIHFLNLPL